MPLNARNKSHELRYAAGHAGLRVLLASDEYTALIEEAGLPDGCRHVVLGEELDAAAADEVLGAPGGDLRPTIRR